MPLKKLATKLKRDLGMTKNKKDKNMKTKFKQFNRIFIIAISLTLISCNAMREFSSGFNEASGNCPRKTAEVWSYANDKWQKGFFAKSSLSEGVVKNVENWVRERNSWYAKNRGVGRFSEIDPYTNREYQFRVY